MDSVGSALWENAFDFRRFQPVPVTSGHGAKPEHCQCSVKGLILRCSRTGFGKSTAIRFAARELVVAKPSGESVTGLKLLGGHEPLDDIAAIPPLEKKFFDDRSQAQVVKPDVCQNAVVAVAHSPNLVGQFLVVAELVKLF